MGGAAASVENLSDMMNWPRHFSNRIAESLPSGALEFLRDRLASGSYSTAFSGVDAPGVAARLHSNSQRYFCFVRLAWRRCATLLSRPKTESEAASTKMFVIFCFADGLMVVASHRLC